MEITARMVDRFEVKIQDIQAAERQGVKYFVRGKVGLFSRWTPKGTGWYLIATPAETSKEAA